MGDFTKYERKTERKKKLAYGVGINDADYVVFSRKVVNGEVLIVECPLYKRWNNMMRRCYYERSLKTRASYEDCFVCEKWKYFSNFRSWMLEQDWEGKHLDKDLLITGNKVYSPDTCIFVHPKINTFVNNCTSSRGKHLLGVTWDKTRNKFSVKCRNPFTGMIENLGRYTDELEAHLAWKAKKHEFACQLADSEYVTDERLANALCTRYNEQSDWTNK